MALSDGFELISVRRRMPELMWQKSDATQSEQRLGWP